MRTDPRVFAAITEAKRTDTSFTDTGLFGMKPKYKQSEVREIWFNAMELGMLEGIRIGSLKGQQMELMNQTDPRKKEFIKKFYKLAKEYNCAISFHPDFGMQIIDLKR